jgi:hypothetical protein
MGKNRFCLQFVLDRCYPSENRFCLRFISGKARHFIDVIVKPEGQNLVMGIVFFFKFNQFAGNIPAPVNALILKNSEGEN